MDEPIDTPESLLRELTRFPPARRRELLALSAVGRAVLSGNESKQIHFESLARADRHANEMRVANPKLPPVPPKQPDDPDAWHYSLCHWCNDAQAIIDKPPEPSIDSPLSADEIKAFILLLNSKLRGLARAIFNQPGLTAGELIGDGISQSANTKAHHLAELTGDWKFQGGDGMGYRPPSPTEVRSMLKSATGKRSA